MLPGKTYDPITVLTILRRHLWLALVPFAVVAAATAVVASLLPDRYRSETLILVVPQRVPESYVKATVTSRIEDRLQALSQQILSRTNLERIIQDFNLYPEQRGTVTMEEIVGEMRRDIRLDVVRGDAFRVAYIGREPRTVMEVTDRLAALVIDENLRDREVLAEGTNQFLESQLQDARQRLMEHEKKLETYRKQYAGELPSQQNSNIQAMQNAQLQIQSIIESINRDRDRRRTVERQLEDLQQEILPALPPVTLQAGDSAAQGGTAAQQLEAARASLQALELRFKPDHPEINLLKRRIRDLERKAEAEALAAPAGAPAVAAVSPAEAARRKRIRDVQGELEALDREIASRQEEERRLRAIAGSYQRRMEMAPTRESELVELTRDYGTLQTIYQNLLTKNEEAKIAASLERRQSGEQFKVLDPARMPERPYSPNRMLIALAGIVLGLGLGVGLIAIAEYRDGSFRTDDEVASVLSLPVLAVIPVMLSNAERRRLLRRRVAVGVGLGATIMGAFAVVVYTLVR